MGAKKYLNTKNLLAIGAAPFTGGLSLGLLNDGEGNTLWGELTGANSAKQANKKNIEMQKETNATTVDLANTAHQREIADLKAAGLNPVLSAGGTGAATPQLGTATVEQTQPGGILGQAAQAANVVNLFSSAKQMATQANLNKTNEKLAPEIAQSEIKKNVADANLAQANADKTNYDLGINQDKGTNSNSTWQENLVKTTKTSAKKEMQEWKEKGKQPGWTGWKHRARSWLFNQ